MKAIILTYAPINESEQKILKNTKLYKLALNQHGEMYNPNARIITDYILPNMCRNFSEKIISVREHLRTYSNRVEYFDTEFKGATIIAGVEYLKYKGYDEILIAGDNNVNHAEFQTLVKEEIDKLKQGLNIYQYTNGNFNLPIKSITDFCICT